MTFSLDVLNDVMRMDYPRNKIVNWQPAHLYMCELNEFDRDNLELFEGYRDYLQAYAEAGIAYSAVVEGEIYAMFGVFQLWPGTAEAWLIPSRKIDRKAIALHRGSLAFFEHAANEMHIKRLQFTVHTRNERADRWAQRCYFKREGLLRNYGPDGSDYFMYARIF